jgi:branched-chain amino acid transport system ATP-binding protein
MADAHRLPRRWRHQASHNRLARESGHPGDQGAVRVPWLWVPAFAGTAVVLCLPTPLSPGSYGMADALLRVSNIETYYGPIMAIRGVSFDVPEGGIVTILGANGAGKTTILKTISGVMDPQKGTVEFAGRAIQRMDPDKVMRLGLSHVPEGREVFPFLSVRENLRMGAYIRSDKDGIESDLAAVYGYFPVLKERAEQRAGQLSGGEQQMLAISRALMSRPRMMLLDEPSLGLSPKLVKEIFAIIRRINRERGVSVLLVEQNATMALKTAEYGYVLELGRLVMEDSCDRLLEKEDIKEFYLGMKAASIRGTRRWKKKKTWR